MTYEIPQELSEMEKKGLLITAILDDVMPISEDVSPDEAEILDVERQSLANSNGWNGMSSAELERIYLEAGNEALPY